MQEADPEKDAVIEEAGVVPPPRLSISGQDDKAAISTSESDVKSEPLPDDRNDGTVASISSRQKNGISAFLRRVVDYLNYVPARCRYDPDKPFHFNLALNLLFAFAASSTVANLYYNHPILNTLAKEFNVSYEKVASIPNVMQAGYACGLLFITPLGDLFRRRPLTLWLILFTVCIWLGCTLTSNFNTFAGLSFVVGASTVTPQLMIPLVGDLAPLERRATSIAIVSSGLQLGILVARVLSGIITQYSNWRTVYWLGFGLQLSIFCLLWLFMPDYPPKNKDLTYWKILTSMAKLLPKHPLLVQASLNGLFLSAIFILLWTTLTFLLASPPYEYNSSIIGVFGLIGIAAISTTPLVGRFVIDKKLPLFSAILGSVIALTGQIIGTYAAKKTVAAPILQSWFVDQGVAIAQVANRHGIYTLDADSRNRINSVYMLSVFIGQVMGTGVGAKTYAVGGYIASGSASVGLCGLGLVVVLLRGPHEKGWVGWTGGMSFRKATAGAENRGADANDNGGQSSGIETGNESGALSKADISSKYLESEAAKSDVAGGPDRDGVKPSAQFQDYDSPKDLEKGALG